MCFFPLSNLNVRGLAYKKGITEFDCGACPECLLKRANVWALRSVYEAREHVHSCMVTLTYDDYVYDSYGHLIGERVSDLTVCKRDVQLFIKRLRKWYSVFNPGCKIKYLLSAEYGKRTHRAHYHAILFGVRFPDLVKYKKSKRGNIIYKSKTLTDLWHNGICTVDSININGSVARYCTKYCAKDRSDDTFMLVSQKVGLNGLVRDFNGKSYVIEGREYPIPRIVWNAYIMRKYVGFNIDYRYVNKSSGTLLNGSYMTSVRLRKAFRNVRDNDCVYQFYLKYWNDKAFSFEKRLQPVEERIRLLDDTKYHFYKINALNCLTRRLSGVPAPAPRSGRTGIYKRWYHEKFPNSYIDEFGACRVISCPNTASDTVPFEKMMPFEKKVCLNVKNRSHMIKIYQNTIDNPFDN